MSWRRWGSIGIGWEHLPLRVRTELKKKKILASLANVRTSGHRVPPCTHELLTSVQASELLSPPPRPILIPRPRTAFSKAVPMSMGLACGVGGGRSGVTTITRLRRGGEVVVEVGHGVDRGRGGLAAAASLCARLRGSLARVLDRPALTLRHAQTTCRGH